MSVKERIIEFIDFKGVSKRGFAASIGKSNSYVNNIVSSISTDVISVIKENYPELNIDWLITGEGEMLLEHPEEKIESNLNDEAKLITNPNIKMIPLVSQYAQAGYLSGFADAEYMETLPRIPVFVDHEPHGNYMAFEVLGDSMDDDSKRSLAPHDILICREVNRDYWRYKLHIKQWYFVIVHKTKGILVKKIIEHDVDHAIITLHSLNRTYTDFQLSLNDVAQIFNVVQVQRRGSDF